MVISGRTEKQINNELQALDDLVEDMIKFSNAPGTQCNNICKEKRYLNFCTDRNLVPFPLDERKLIQYAMFLSFTMQTIDSIKSYCTTVCDLYELQGFPPLQRTKRYFKALDSIKRTLSHEVHQATPITEEILKNLVTLVDLVIRSKLRSGLQ